MIGIFDSGIGGLGIYHELKKRLPHVGVLYVADYAFAPYGDKTPKAIRERVVSLTHDLEEKGAQMGIAACNTATVLALSEMRAATCIPVVGTVPAVKPAVETSTNGNIVVLGTTRTCNSAYQKNLIAQYGKGKNIQALALPGLVDCIENRDTQSETFLERMKIISKAVQKQTADTIVLGCTHFTLIQNEIQQVVGSTVHIIDSNAAVARQAERVAMQSGLEISGGNDRFTSTDTHIAFQTRISWALAKL